MVHVQAMEALCDRIAEACESILPRTIASDSLPVPCIGALHSAAPAGTLPASQGGPRSAAPGARQGSALHTAPQHLRHPIMQSWLEMVTACIQKQSVPVR